MLRETVTRVVYLPGLPAYLADELAARTGTDCTAHHESGGLYTLCGLPEAINQLMVEAQPHLSGLAAVYDSMPTAILSLSPN